MRSGVRFAHQFGGSIFWIVGALAEARTCAGAPFNVNAEIKIRRIAAEGYEFFLRARSMAIDRNLSTGCVEAQQRRAVRRIAAQTPLSVPALKRVLNGGAFSER